VFDAVSKKLERADYFLNNIKALAEASGGFAHVDDQHKLRANLDAFFFELISAKDFFLQEINEKYVRLPKDEATQIDKLKRCLSCSGHTDTLMVVELIERELSNKNSWLWRLNNYRNSATHRELLRFGHEAGLGNCIKTHLFKDPEDPKQGNADIEVIPYCEQSLEHVRIFLGDLYSKLHI